MTGGLDSLIRMWFPLMIGTNDCATSRDISPGVFEQNLDTLVTLIRELKAIPVFQTPNVIIKEKAQERSRIDEYVSVMQKAGRKKGSGTH